MSIRAESHAAANQLVLDALAGVSINVHGAPLPETQVAAPVAMVLTPEATGQVRLSLCAWTFTVRVLVVSSDTIGSDLLALADEVMVALAQAGLMVTSEPASHNLPNGPAALPAVLIRGE